MSMTRFTYRGDVYRCHDLTPECRLFYNIICDMMDEEGWTQASKKALDGMMRDAGLSDAHIAASWQTLGDERLVIKQADGTSIFVALPLQYP